MSWVDDYKFVDPFWDLREDAQGAQVAKHHTAELETEVGWTHPLTRRVGWARRLWGHQWTVVAKAGPQDDVIAVSETGVVALVHLTCSGRRESPPWPNAVFLESLAEFQREARLRYE